MKSDTELIQEYIAGNMAGLQALVDRYSTQIYMYVYRLSGEPEETTDLVQQTFVKAWRGLESFDQNKSFKAWLFAIARNTTFDYLRKNRPTTFSEIDEHIGESGNGGDGHHESFAEKILDPEPLPDEIFKRNETGMLLGLVLDTISPKYKSVILLHHMNELSFREIAEMTGLSSNTIASQYRRGMKVLREKLLKKYAQK